ncbi:MAG: ABC transporter substrate-binding protein [Candidatus Bathyarchaeota archaeon]|nr:ABC transporter substrate-binding protein [Candidatus Bathyarchaeota archaeon]
MNKTIIAGALLTIIIASSLVVGYSQNWFQPTETPQNTSTPTPTGTPQPTTEPTTSNPPTATPTKKPTPTANPTAKPTTQPTTVSAMNLTLEIYGNANMDDKIDSTDATYIQQIIDGSRTATQFADANRDGTVNTADVTQVNALLSATASKIYMLDGNKANISVSLPANRLVVEYNQNTELVRILGVENLVVGIDAGVEPVKQLFYPNNYASITMVGQMSSPDYEAVLNLHPTTLFTFTAATADKAAHLPGVDVVYLGLYNPNVTKPEDSRFIQGVLKAGYIFNKVDRATEYANWILNLTSTINAKVNTIPEAQLKSVMITNCPTLTTGAPKAYTAQDTLGQACILSGGKNIASSLTGASITIDTEFILNQNPAYIFVHTVRYTYGGLTQEPPQGIDATDPTGMKYQLAQYIAQPGFANLTAVQNGHVYMIAGDFRNNAMGGTLGAVYMAKVLYPDVFSSWNPQAIHQEYFTRFLRLDYNLDTKGVYLYPTISVNGDIVGIPNAAA